MPSIQVLPSVQSGSSLIGQQLGAGIGQGLSQGITQKLKNLLETKKNNSSAQGLLKGLGLPENVRQNLQFALSKVPAEQQSKALLDFYDIARAAPQIAKAFSMDNKSFQEAHSGGSVQQNLKSGLQEALGQQTMPQEEKSIFDQQEERQPPITQRQERETKFRQAEETLGLKKAKLNLDETKDYRSHVASASRSAEELDPVLDQMEQLIKRGKLTNPVIAKLADKAGLVGLLDPSSQQFQALAVGFLKDAKNIFGSRVTNFDLQAYLDKIPRLAQTDIGKKVLIDNFRALGEASKIRNKALHEVIKQNKGIPPLDVEEKVSEKVKPQMDKLADKFNASFIQASKSKSGKIQMRHPNGTLGEVPEEKVREAMQKGYTLQ